MKAMRERNEAAMNEMHTVARADFQRLYGTAMVALRECGASADDLDAMGLLAERINSCLRGLQCELKSAGLFSTP